MLKTYSLVFVVIGFLAGCQPSPTPSTSDITTPAKSIDLLPEVAQFLAEHKEFGEPSRAEEMPDWSKWKRQKVVFESPGPPRSLLFYLKDNKVAIVYEGEVGGGKVLWVATPTLDAASLQAAKGLADRAEIRDKTGGVIENGVDIKKVSLTSDGTNLIIAIEVEGNLVNIFKGRTAGDGLTLNLDTDLNNTTGGKLVFIKKEGFEYEVKVNVCLVHDLQPGRQSVACGGGCNGVTPKAMRSGVDVSEFDKTGEYSTTGMASSLHLPQGPITATRIEASVPYNLIGCSSGQGIRVLAKERDSKPDDAGRGYLQEVRYRLK